MNNPLISIIVAIYNGEKFLEKCIDSIISQSYKNIEIILVDDGSVDKSGFICDQYKKKDSRIIVYHKKNGGVCSARNVGIDNSHGEYICIIDQDDWLDVDYINYLYKLVKEDNTNVAFVPQVVFSTEENEFYNETKDSNSRDIISGKHAACLMLNGLIEIGPWNKIISKKMIEEKEIRFNTDLFGGEGYLFSIDSFMNSKKVSVGYKGIYHYRIDNYTSEMSKFRMRTAQSSFNSVNIMKERYYGLSKELNKSLNFAEWDVYYIFLIKMIASNSVKMYNKEYKLWKRKLRKDIKYLIKANIPFKRKLKYALITYCTSAFIFMKKIKNKIFTNKNNRNYNLAE